MAKNRVECRWCGLNKARPKRIVLNRDGSKNYSDPWLYASFFLALGITITTRVAEQWQGWVATAFIVVGAAVVIRLIYWRHTLPPGIEYKCSDCGFRWYEDAPTEKEEIKQDKRF